MVDAFAWTTQSLIGHMHRHRENIWDTAVPQTETPTTVVTAVTLAMVVTTVLTIAKAVTGTVVVVSPVLTRIVTVILTAVIVVTAIAIGAGAHLLVVTHPTIVGAGAIPEALREAVALLGRQGIMMAPRTAPAGNFALCHYLST
jgi:hypothetical protein